MALRWGRALLLGCLAQAGAWAQAEYRLAPEEQTFLNQLDREGHPLESREAARAYLSTHPNSIAACVVIGTVDFQEEGDLPRADYYLRRARSLLESQFREPWASGAPWRLYARVLHMQFWTYMQMDRYTDALEALDMKEAHFLPKRPSWYGWPLMKLGRERQARSSIAMALLSPDLDEQENALNTLGALEGEGGHPEAAWEVSSRLYEMCHRPGRVPRCTYVRNHGEHAEKLGRADVAERLYLEATQAFDPNSFSNPWQDLVSLYLDQQRFPECLDAVRQMHGWSFRQQPHVGLGNWNRRQSLTACLLFYCGYTDEALDIAGRLTELPDRHGSGSAQADLWTAGSLFFYHQVLQDALARDEEALSYAPWKTWPKLWAQRARHGAASFSASRRAGRILMSHKGWLASSLRVLTPEDAVSLPGGEIMLPQIVGAGVVEGELGPLLRRTGPAADRERGWLLLYLGAARLQRGDAAGAKAALEEAETRLPANWGLERTQLHALQAQALGRLGDARGALKALLAVMAKDGGAVRRFGLRLPCRIEATAHPAAAKAGELLKGSPRLAPGQAGFRVRVEALPSGGLQGGLEGPSGEVLCRFRVAAQADPAATAREFCRAFHLKAFGPHIDLSQEQIHSLSGSTLAGEGLHEQLKDLVGTHPVQ